jgi:hypothetical protein
MEPFCESFEHYASNSQLPGGKWDDGQGQALPILGGQKWLGLGHGFGFGGTSHIMKSVQPTVQNQILLGFACWLEKNRRDTILRLRDGSTTMLQLTYDPADALFRVERGSGNTLITFGPVPQATRNYIEMRVQLDGVNGSVEVQLNGAPAGNFAGNTIAAGAVLNNIHFSGSQSSGDGQWSLRDVYIMDYGPFLGDVTVKAIVPVANGAQNDWTASAGQNFEAVGEVTPDDADYVHSNVAGARELYAMADPALTPGSLVHFVQVIARAQKQDAGARALKLLVASGATVGQSADTPLSTSFRYHARSFPLNPDTGTAWTPAAVAAMQTGVECV